jgi:hypothetical protein
MFGKKELTIPLGPRVVFTRSAIAIAPMKDACMPNRDFNIGTHKRTSAQVAWNLVCLNLLDLAWLQNSHTKKFNTPRERQ